VSAWLLQQEIALRLGSFLAVFLTMAAWEMVAERRRLLVGRGRRWFANLSLVAFNNVLLRVLFPAVVFGGALVASEQGWGVLNAVQVPGWVAIPLSLVLLDLAIFLQHVLFHAVPLLWRLHLVHHADPDLDVTSGARFHPIEIVLSLFIKVSVVVVLGVPAVAVLLFEIALNATAMFNHSNVRLVGAADRWLRLIVVTPDMHRVHHSTDRAECNSNFGFNLPWWDHLLGTYRAQPRAGHEAMSLGVAHVPNPERQPLQRLLVMPFVTPAGEYPVRRSR
jgi:sterol desaturase/sphingolipid hydroxylase (fatty acid hydroxylase superfamily)